MNALPQALQEAIDTLSDLPGIGKRSAERLALSILNNPSNIDQKIASSIGTLKQNVHECKRCFHYCEEEICSICDDDGREGTQLCIVESPIDLIALERCHEYKCRYHVLHGILSPLNKIKPEDIRLKPLFEKIQSDTNIREIIIATPNNTEGDATALYIIREIKPFYEGAITHLSRGIPSGGDLDYLDIGTLGRAIQDRRSFL